jgi:hypothetical protein
MSEQVAAGWLDPAWCCQQAHHAPRKPDRLRMIRDCALVTMVVITMGSASLALFEGRHLLIAATVANHALVENNLLISVEATRHHH